jgi:hypothetical protein
MNVAIAARDGAGSPAGKLSGNRNRDARYRVHIPFIAIQMYNQKYGKHLMNDIPR